MDAPGLPPCLRVWSIGCWVISQHGDTRIKEDVRTFHSVTKDFAVGLYTRVRRSHRQNGQTEPFLEKSDHPQDQCNFFACRVRLSLTSMQVPFCYRFLKRTSCVLSSFVPWVGMGSGGGWKLWTFMGFNGWICRCKSLQPGMCNPHFLLKRWIGEVGWGRRGDEARCTIFMVQPYTDCLPSPRACGL